MTTPFTSTPITGPTYTDLAHEVDRLKADIARYVHALNFIEHDISEGRPEAARQRAIDVMTPDHPGSALLDELENLRKQVASLRGDVNEARDSSKYQATRAESEMLGRIELEKQVEALKAGQRSASEARQRAFLELAEDLAEMTPEKRDAAIKRIIDNAGENRP